MFDESSGPPSGRAETMQMGETTTSDEGFIDYTGGRSAQPALSDVDSRSQATADEAARRGGPAGGAAFDDDYDREPSYMGSEDRESSLDQAFAAGMPIGLLAALGTPYAKKPIYRSKKFKVLCLAIVPLTIAVTIILTVFPILKGIANHALHTSVLHVYTSNITTPRNDGFGLTLNGQVKKTGIFPAQIAFTQPVEVYWIDPQSFRELQLGVFNLAPLGAAAGHARINQETHFNITDQDAFGLFASYLITQESFTWQLRSLNVEAKAFSFLSAPGLTFKKDLTLNGMANFTNVMITDFQLPGDDPQGGVSLIAATSLVNPSAFGLEIGILAVDLYYQGLYLGPAQTTSAVNLTSGLNNVTLGGRLIDHTGNQTALAQLGQLFSGYLNGDTLPTIAVGRSVTLPDGTQVSWLNQAIKSLILNVPLRAPQGQIHPIKSITIQTFTLSYTPATAYSPTAFSPAVSAGLSLPFGFSLNISQAAVTFAIVQNRTLIAALAGSYGAGVTMLTTRNSGQTDGTLSLSLPAAPLLVPDTYEGHLTLDQFQYDLALGSGAGFFLNGTTNAVTQTPLGQVILTDVGFTVPTGLIGLDGLTQYPTLILSVDVTGGTTQYLSLLITVGLTNPSNLILAVGDVTFQLFTAADSAFIGRTVLPNLTLTGGYQTHSSVGEFEANNNPSSLTTLNNFANGIDTPLLISGFNGSTQVQSLTQAFMGIHLNATLGGLKTKLLNSASLTVLSTTGRTNDIADASVSLQNPFSAPLTVTHIASNVTARGLFIGSITTDIPFTAAGNTATSSPELPFVLNLYPPTIFSLLRELVLEAGLDPAPLDGIVQLGGYQYQPTTGRGTRRKRSYAADEWADDLVGVDKMAELPSFFDQEAMRSPELGDFDGAAGVDAVEDLKRLVKRVTNIYTGFNLPNYVDTAFKQLTVNVDLLTTVTFGQYTTQLTYTQKQVPTITDSTLNLLLPVLAQPIVQKIVDGATLTVSTVIIQDPQETSFDTVLTGAIRNSGPFDAVITFPQGLTVAWNGQPLGQIAMPQVALEAEVGATLNLNAAFNVASVSHLTDFTSYLLTEDSFNWQIYGQNLEIAALGITVDSVSIQKEVLLLGLNNLRGGVIINSFDLPYNDPAGGVHLTLATSVTNPSSVGVSLSQIGFQNFFDNVNIGPVASTAPFVLAPLATISLPLAGRLIPQTSQTGLDAVSAVFNGFIHGQPVDVVVAGDYAGPTGVSWLNTGIKSLNTPVILPAAANLQIIQSITINQLSLFFTVATAYDPPFSTTGTTAAFQLPFAFPIDLTQAGGSIVSGYDGNNFAVLDVPLVAAQTNVVARLTTLAFSNVPFAVYGDQHQTFSDFLTRTTDDASITFQLSGSLDSVANTAIGALNVNDITFSVPTTLAGLQGLNARPAYVTDLDVYHGYPSYLQINANAHLYNPSQITIGTGDVVFDLSFQGVVIGTANIANLILVPGENVVATAVHYEPTGSAQPVGQLLLENFVQRIVSTTTILGTTSTTPIESLQQALSTIRLVTDIPPLEQNLIPSARLELPLDVSTTGIGNTYATLVDPFTAAINIDGLIATAIYPIGNIDIGVINQPSLNPALHVDGHTSAELPALPLQLNLDPRVLSRLILAVANNQSVSLGPLTDRLNFVIGLSDAQIANYSRITTTVNQAIIPVNTACTSGQQFDVFDAVLTAFRNLHVTLQIQSQVSLDDYATPLNFNQFDVAVYTDQTLLYLIGAVGKPIVQNIVDQATLSFANGNITQVTSQGFQVALQGQLLNTGPFDAQIQITNGLGVIWQGRDIATITLPTICAFANQGVPNYQTTAQLTITDKGAFTDFATYILHNPSFTWVVHSDNIEVIALATNFQNVGIAKVISFLAFNGLPGVTISNFNLPRDDADGQSIDLSTDSLIPSPANLGIQLDTVNFVAYYNATTENTGGTLPSGADSRITVGPVTGNNLFLALMSTTREPLTGRIIRRQSEADSATLGVLFSRFLGGYNQTLDVVGDSVVTQANGNQPVDWLTTAFKTLHLAVILPGKVYQIIESILVSDFELVINKASQDFAIDTSNELTTAVFRNPFGFSLGVARVATDITIIYNGANAAAIATCGQETPFGNNAFCPVVSSGVSTGQDANLQLNFQNRSLGLASGGQGAYQSFIAAVTDGPTQLVPFNLSGTASVLGNLVVGLVPITGIPFNVATNFPSINSFNAPNGISINGYPTVYGVGSANTRFQFTSTDPGPTGSDYISLYAGINIVNPAPIQLTSNNISLPVYYSGGGAFTSTLIGVASLASITLDAAPQYTTLNQLTAPATTNNLTSQVQYQPQNDLSTAYDLVTQYLYGSAPGGRFPSGNIPITIAKPPTNLAPTSPYQCLVPALQGLQESAATFEGIGIPGANVGPNPAPGKILGVVGEFIANLPLLETFCTNDITFNFRVLNNLAVPLAVYGVKGLGYTGCDSDTIRTGSCTGGGQLYLVSPPNGQNPTPPADFAMVDPIYMVGPNTLGPVSEYEVPVKLIKGLFGSISLLFGQETTQSSFDGTSGIDFVANFRIAVGGENGYVIQNLSYAQPKVQYIINISLTKDSVQLTPQGLLGLISDPLSLLSTLVGILTDAIQIGVNGCPTLEGQGQDPISQICGVISMAASQASSGGLGDIPVLGGLVSSLANLTTECQILDSALNGTLINTLCGLAGAGSQIPVLGGLLLGNNGLLGQPISTLCPNGVGAATNPLSPILSGVGSIVGGLVGGLTGLTSAVNNLNTLERQAESEINTAIGNALSQFSALQTTAQTIVNQVSAGVSSAFAGFSATGSALASQASLATSAFSSYRALVQSLFNGLSTQLASLTALNIAPANAILTNVLSVLTVPALPTTALVKRQVNVVTVVEQITSAVAQAATQAAAAVTTVVVVTSPAAATPAAAAAATTSTVPASITASYSALASSVATASALSATAVAASASLAAHRARVTTSSATLVAQASSAAVSVSTQVASTSSSLISAISVLQQSWASRLQSQSSVVSSLSASLAAQNARPTVSLPAPLNIGLPTLTAPATATPFTIASYTPVGVAARAVRPDAQLDWQVEERMAHFKAQLSELVGRDVDVIERMERTRRERSPARSPAGSVFDQRRFDEEFYGIAAR